MKDPVFYTLLQAPEIIKKELLLSVFKKENRNSRWRRRAMIKQFFESEDKFTSIYKRFALFNQEKNEILKQPPGE